MTASRVESRAGLSGARNTFPLATEATSAESGSPGRETVLAAREAGAEECSARRTVGRSLDAVAEARFRSAPRAALAGRAS